MKCEEIRETLPLFLYGELASDEEERFESHIHECSACRVALEREKALFRSLDAAEAVPEPSLLAQCRAELHRNLSQAQPEREGFWDRVRDTFSIRFHPAPRIAQPVGALAMLVLGFMAARMLPDSALGSWRGAGVMEPATSRVRYVEPTTGGQIRITVDETRQRVLSGDLDDQQIQRLLVAAAKDPADEGLRVESVDLLGNRAQSAEVRSALLYALQHDSNAGVRLKALDGLKAFASDPETSKTLTQVLLTDDNPGVRTQVIDLLVPRQSTEMVGILQELMTKEDNDYVRMRCQKILQDLRASVDTY